MGDAILRPRIMLHPSARIEVTERLVIGDHSTMRQNVVIEGRDIEIGQGAWILPWASERLRVQIRSYGIGSYWRPLAGVHRTWR